MNGDVCDVAIVGGGPAGLATALACRRHGLNVTVIDRRRTIPFDKPCGEGLMPDGLASLERLGVQLKQGQGRRFHGISYFDGETVARGRFPGASGLGIRRLDLHQELVDTARQAGVELRFGEVVEAVEFLSSTGKSQALLPPQPAQLSSASGVVLRTDARRIESRWLVGADGLRSRIRQWAGLEARGSSRFFGRQAGSADRNRRFGVRRHFRQEPWSDMVEVYWTDHAEAYVTPVSNNEVGVAILWSRRKAGFDELLQAFPRLLEHLAGAEATSPGLGCGPLEQKVQSVACGPVALVGDASGYVDAITGEGLSLAFQQAETLGEALASGDLSTYRRHVARLRRLPDLITRSLLFAERRPALRRRVVRTLATEPALFNRLLGIHARQLPPRSIGVLGALRGLARLGAGV